MSREFPSFQRNWLCISEVKTGTANVNSELTDFSLNTHKMHTIYFRTKIINWLKIKISHSDSAVCRTKKNNGKKMITATEFQ